jgi:hypothetical protein
VDMSNTSSISLQVYALAADGFFLRICCCEHYVRAMEKFILMLGSQPSIFFNRDTSVTVLSSEVQVWSGLVNVGDGGWVLQ